MGLPKATESLCAASYRPTARTLKRTSSLELCTQLRSTPTRLQVPAVLADGSDRSGPWLQYWRQIGENLIKIILAVVSIDREPE